MKSIKTDAANTKKVLAKKVRKKWFNVSVFLCALLIVGLIGVKLHNDVQLNELTVKTSDLKKELNVQQSEETRLNVLLEERTNLKEIERRATDELNLKKIDKSQIQYVSLPTADKTETIKTEDKNIFNSVIRGFSIILEFLS